MKTVRFAELVARAGAPESYQLWMPAAKDPVFQRAVRGHRVLTIHQENVGGKKDYGMVGFHEEPLAEFLVFPKSIREFEGRRVVGVKYELLAPDSRPASSWHVGPSTDRTKPAPPRKQATTAGRESRKVVRFEAPPASAAPPAADARPPRRGTPKRLAAVKRQPQRTPLERRLLAEVTRARRELERGKSVAAYTRLQRLTDAAGKG